MLGFVRQLGQRVCGVLSGFDRLLFRGILRCVIDPRGLNGYLYGAKVAMTDYGRHVEQVSRQLKEASLAHAKEVGCEIRYLDNSQERKKDVAIEIAQRDGIRAGGGLICVLSCVEPCATFDVQRDPVATPLCRRALLIGVNRYEQLIVPPTPMPAGVSLPIEMLKPFPYRRWFAERDLEVLAEELRRHDYDVQVLLGSGLGEERATKQNIDAVVLKLQSERKAGDLVLVAFAGYARQVQWRDSQGNVLKNDADQDRHDVLLAPLDVSSRNAQSYLSLTELVKRLNPHGGQETLFLIDGCRDATAAGQPGSLTGTELQGELPDGTALLFGSTSPDPSRERRHGESGGGVFFERCVDALRGETASSQGAVTWDDFLATFRRHPDHVGKDETSLGVWCPDPHAPVAHIGHMQNAVESHHFSNSPLLVPPQPPIESKKFGPHECVLIPGGTFEMGAVPEDQDADADEYPRHQVRVTKPFYMSRHEVTVEQFKAFAAESRDKYLDEQLAHDVRTDKAKRTSSTDAIERRRKSTNRRPPLRLDASVRIALASST